MKQSILLQINLLKQCVDRYTKIAPVLIQFSRNNVHTAERVIYIYVYVVNVAKNPL